MTPGPEDHGQRGLSRDRLVQSALALVQEVGLEGLSMRALADSLEVKAASLYWHVRDRRELVELLAGSILEDVGPRTSARDWRSAVLQVCAELRERVEAQNDASRILLEVPDALLASSAFTELKGRFEAAGLQPAEAAEVALMAMVHVIAGEAPPQPTVAEAETAASISVDSGSRGVLLRAGEDMQTLVSASADRRTSAPAIVRGETVIVRRIRGVGVGEIHLNPGRPWRFRVQGPTWNTTIDAGGLDVREVHMDSGAARVEVFLPEPHGTVPVRISGGVVDVRLHRPPGVAVVANVSTGAVQLKFDDYALKVAVSDVRWESEGAARAADRYELRVSGGAVKVSLDQRASRVRGAPPAIAPADAAPVGEPVSALEILLDGVEARVRSRA